MGTARPSTEIVVLGSAVPWEKLLACWPGPSVPLCFAGSGWSAFWLVTAAGHGLVCGARVLAHGLWGLSH